MSTLADYKALIDALGYNTAQLGTAADTLINDSRRRVMREHRWTWLEGRDTSTLTTTAGDRDVALAGLANLAHIDAVRLTQQGNELVTEFLPYQQVRDMEAYDDAWWFSRNDVDYFWTTHNGQIIFYPEPAATMSLDIDYITLLPELTGVTVDTVPDGLRDVIAWGAVPAFAFRKRDANSLQLAEQMYTTRLRTAIVQDATPQRQSSRQIRTGYWGS